MLYLLLAVFLIPGILYALLNSSVVQTYLAQKAAAYFSEELKTEISIKKLSISPFLDVTMENILVKDRHKNNMFFAKSLFLDFDDITFKNHKIGFNKATIDNPYIAVVRYKEEKDFNFQFMADYFSSGKKDTTKIKKKSIWQYSILGVNLINAHLIYDLENKDSLKYGLDFNHIDVSQLNADISKIDVIEDSISVDIVNMSFIEKSGFKILSLKTLLTYTPQRLAFRNTVVKTPDSELNFYLGFKYDNFSKDFSHFGTNIKTHLIFNKSTLNTRDMAYFVPDLKGMNFPLEISADFKGKINNLKGKDIVITCGKHTAFKGSLVLTGLPDINGTFINADIKELYTSKNDLESIKMPDGAGGKYLKLPAELAKLGNITYRGKFTGFINDFVSYGNIYTDIGMISTDLSLKNNTETKVISYKGKIGAEDFDIGKMLSSESTIGKVSLNATVAGSGFNFNTANLTIDGIIKSIDLNQYAYKNIDIKGKFANKTFNGKVDINDKNIGLAFTGLIDLSAETPRFHLSSELRNVNLTALNLLKGDTITDLSSSLVMNFKGNNIDNFYGNIEITNTSFKKKDQKFSIGFLNLSNYVNNKGEKVTKVDADFLNGEIIGVKSVKGLQRTFLAFLNVYLPSFKFKTNEFANDTISQNITYAFSFKNSDSILNLIVPTLKIANNTTLHGVYNSGTNSLTIQGNSPYIEYQKIRMQNWNINGKSDKQNFILSTGCERLILTDTIYVDNFNVFTNTNHDSINYKIVWKNDSQKVNNSADISGLFNLARYPAFEIIFNKSDIVVRDTLLTISQGNKITIDTSSIKLSNFVIGNKSQQVYIDGTISDIATDKLNVVFKNFNLSNLDVFTVRQQLDFNGTLNGMATLYDLHYSPNVQADISIKDFAFNNEYIGDATIKSSWDNFLKALLIKAEVGFTENAVIKKPVEINGKYFPYNKNNNLDFVVKISRFKLDPLGKFLSSFASEITGYASGTIELKGSSSEPDISGTVSFDPAQLKVDYLNTVYHFTQDITFDKNSISFDDVILYDEKGKTAKLNGKIYHNNFKDWALSLSILSNNFFCLNTNIAMNSDFYGRAYMTGLTKIYGTTENINIDVNAKTEKGTQLFIPISSNSEISEYPFVSFVNTTSESFVKDQGVDLSGIRLNFDLEVTPDAEVQIIFDSKSGDIIKATGSANLKLEITTLGDFNMYGSYLIEKGDYLFTVKNIINKRFDIVKGGTIKWNGDPFDATINISPVYKLRTSLYDLYTKSNPNIQDPDTSKKRVPVECIINMTDNLFNPTIAFDIDFPSLNDNSKQEYKAVVKPEMNNQFLSLLIMNKFISPSQENSTAGGNNVIGTTTSELLSNQLSNWLSQISNDFDLGVNYRAGNEMNKDEIEVALSTKFFNDKLTIDGNVGNGGGAAQSSSNIVGDVNIEYKWTEEGRFRIKAFNKSNEIDILTPNSPYTQGVGIFYRKEFDSFKDLLKRKKPKDRISKKDTIK